MLPAASRLRHRDEFATVLRAGRRRTDRCRPARLVAHVAFAAPLPSVVLVPDLSAEPRSAEARSVGTSLTTPLVTTGGPAQVGFIVSRAVGGAVVRNRVRRRLRHLMAARLPTLPAGSRVVVRALPGAAGASSAELAVSLDRALAPVVGLVVGR